jgi:hypothetical protein
MMPSGIYKRKKLDKRDDFDVLMLLVREALHRPEKMQTQPRHLASMVGHVLVRMSGPKWRQDRKSADLARYFRNCG